MDGTERKEMSTNYLHTRTVFGQSNKRKTKKRTDSEMPKESESLWRRREWSIVSKTEEQ